MGVTSMDPAAEAENFGGIASRSGADPASADVVIVRAPYEGTVSYGTGTAAGPAAILAASAQVETHDDETGVNLEELSFALGPTLSPGDLSPEDYSEAVRVHVRSLAESGKVPFVWGGEHSVTIGAARGVRDVHPRAHVLSIDAHADLRQSYGGTEYSHACVSRRLLDGGSVTIVGVRSYSAEEARFAARVSGLGLVPARDVRRGMSLDGLVSSLGPKVYLTIDVDGLDPSVIPATGTPEPGGLSWDDALELLRRVFERRTVVGMDLVELAPVAGSHVSEFAAARLAAKMLTYRQAGSA